MELADMRDLGSRAARRAGSTPVTRTKMGTPKGCPFWCGKQNKVGSAHAKRDGSDGTCPGRCLVPEGEFNPRQKNSAPFRFHGFRKSIATREKRATIKACQESSISVSSFFLWGCEKSQLTV